MARRKTAETRFWEKVDKRGPNECWPWTSAVNWRGYPLFSKDGRQSKATHIALEFDGRPRPSAPGNYALHSDECATRRCVNPRHLRWGTPRDNVHDAIRVGRHATPVVCGERQGASRLTSELVRQIRNSPESGASIARRLGVSVNTVCRARRRDSWASVK